MDNRDAALKLYYRSIRVCLPSSLSLKHRILAEIKTNINTFLEENPTADFAAIQERFGTPQQIAATYVENLDTDELLQKLRIRKNIVSITAFVMVAALVVWLAAVGWCIADANAVHDGGIEKDTTNYSTTGTIDE